jgi:hypothetical protein
MVLLDKGFRNNLGKKNVGNHIRRLTLILTCEVIVEREV